MTETPIEPVKVARDLREICDLSQSLADQAVARHSDHLMPGGEAMVMLAPVGDPEAWQHQFDAREELGRSTDHVDDEDEAWEPPLQTLLFWSEAWRADHGKTSDRRPTVESEAGFLRGLLDWIYDNEPRWDDFAADVRSARVRLENVLYDGERDETGAPCLYCRAFLYRDRDKSGGFVDSYTCRRCQRHYPADEYRFAVAAAAKAHAGWLPMTQLVERCEVRAGTVRVWANRGEVKKRKDHESGRVVYRVKDVLRMLGEDEGVAS